MGGWSVRHRRTAILGWLALVSIAYVGGTTAGSTDFTATMDAHLPIVFAFVLGLAFALLLVTFQSIVIPLKTILLNPLSVGAAYGVVTLIFLRGMRTSDAVSEGLKATAGVVTSAAIVMVAVFSIFAIPPRLLGEWNWYLPRLRTSSRVARWGPTTPRIPG